MIGDRLYRTPVVALGSSFYIFGGDNGSISATIACFSTISKQWSKVGELNDARYAHGVFADADHFVVVGGYGSFSTERCYFTNKSQLQCETVNPVVDYYIYYPEMMSVQENYCD